MQKICFISLFCLSISSFAESSVKLTDKIVDFKDKGENALSLEVTSNIGYIDNFLYQDKDTSDTFFLSLNPSAYIGIQSDAQFLQIYTNINYFQFSEFEEDDHSNTQFAGKYQIKLSDKSRVYMSGGYQETFEYRGSGLTQGEAEIINTGDEFKNSFVNVGFKFGQLDSVAKLESILGQKKERYLTRRDETRELDYEENFFITNFDYVLSGKTYIATTFEYIDVEYDYSSELSREEYTGLVGLKWGATDISTFSVLVGYQHLTFEDALFEDDDSLRWRVDLNWSPLERLKIKIASARDTQASNQLEDSYRIVDSFSISTNYEVSERLKLTIAPRYSKDKSIYVSNSLTDNYLSLDFSVDYKFNDWFTVKGNYGFEDKDSDELGYDYERNLFSVSFNVNF